MATVVNARDVLLQNATPRVATVEMAPNLVVSQDQVSGLGIVVEGTKMALLQATAQVFQIAKTGTVTPASTTLTSLVKNLSATPTLTVISGTITPTPALVGGTVTIQSGDIQTDTATLRLEVIEGGTTYSDEVTLVKVKEGSDGVTGLLTNESHTVPADQQGNVLSYSGCGGTFKMYQGTTDITTLCTYSVVDNPSTLTVALNAATGVYVVSGGYPTNTDTTTITFRATFGSMTYDKVFTITKSKNGIVGQRGSRTWYVALTGTTATYSDTLATTTASADGGPILNDTVTQYNNSQNFSQTKFWDGSAWQLVNAVVDGNLLVGGSVGAQKVAANAIETYHIKAGAVDATKITVATLAAINASLGAVQIDAGGYIRTSGVTGYITGTNGIWAGEDGGVYKLRIGSPTTGNSLKWDGTNLTINGGGTFSGDLAAATGTFSGTLSAASGTFTGSLSGATGTFAGSLNAATGTFSGNLNAAGGTFAGSLSAATGTFAGSLTAQVVQTSNIVGAAISTSASGSGLSSASASVSVPAGSSSLIALVDPGAYNTGGGPISIGGGSLVRDGSTITTQTNHVGMMLFSIENPTAGTWTINGSGNEASWRVDNVRVCIIVTKR